MDNSTHSVPPVAVAHTLICQAVLSDDAQALSCKVNSRFVESLEVPLGDDAVDGVFPVFLVLDKIEESRVSSPFSVEGVDNSNHVYIFLQRPGLGKRKITRLQAVNFSVGEEDVVAGELSPHAPCSTCARVSRSSNNDSAATDSVLQRLRLDAINVGYTNPISRKEFMKRMGPVINYTCFNHRSIL